MSPGCDGLDGSPGPSLFGVGLTSDLLDASLLPIARIEATVIIRRRMVLPSGLPMVQGGGESGFACHSDGECVVLRWPDAAFRVSRDGVDVDSVRPQEAVGLYLVAVWSFVLALHGRRALHGSVVARGGQAVAILGDSGAGKSTIAARAVEAGWDLVADDLVSCSGTGEVAVGQPFTRLLLGPSAGDPTGEDKVRVPARLAQSATLAAVVVMSEQYPALAPLRGTEALDAILTHRFIPFAAVTGQLRREMEHAARIVRTVPVYGAPPRSLTVAQLTEALDGSGPRP